MSTPIKHVVFSSYERSKLTDVFAANGVENAFDYEFSDGTLRLEYINLDHLYITPMAELMLRDQGVFRYIQTYCARFVTATKAGRLQDLRSPDIRPVQFYCAVTWDSELERHIVRLLLCAPYCEDIPVHAN